MSARVQPADGDVLETRVEFAAPREIRAFIDDPAFVTGIFGPFGSAKTSAGAWKGWGYAQCWPGARIAVIRSTWPALEDTTQRTFFEWFPPGVAGAYAKTKKVFTLHLGEDLPPAEFLFRGLASADDIQKVLSLDLAAAWIDEPQGGIAIKRDGTVIAEPGIAHDLWRAILGRCGRQRGYPKMLWMSGNPPPPSHWIAKEFQYDPGASGHDAPENARPGFHLYLVDQDTNRENLPRRYYEDLEDAYGTGTPMARRFLYGEWIEWAQQAPFQSAWVRFWGTEDHPRPNLSDLLIKAAIDPAISKRDTAASSAIVVAGQLVRGVGRGTVYVLHATKGHWTVYEQVRELLRVVREYKVRIVQIEDVAYQRGLGEVLDHEAREAGVTVHVELVKPEGDKLLRANSWSGLVQNGTVLFGPGQKVLLDALFAVPQDPSQWDLVDAAGMAVRGFHTMPAPASQLPSVDRDGQKIASTYAVRDLRPTVSPRSPGRPGPARAASYAVRRRPTAAPLRSR